jgi:PAS domain-containing protein
LWKSIAAEHPWRGQLRNRRKDGSTYIEEMTVAPVHDDNGALTNFIISKEDITASHEAEVALRESRELLELAMRADSDKLWDWSLVTSEAYLTVEGGELRIAIPIPEQTAESLRSGHVNRDSRSGSVRRQYEAEVRIRKKDRGHLWLSLEGR